MKKFYLLFLFIAFSTFIFSQEVRDKNKSRDQITSYLKDSVVTIDGINFDYRVLRYYDRSKLTAMSAVKRKQVNYIYTGSYSIVDTKVCPTLNILEIDAAKLDSFRKEDESVIIEIGETCKVQVKLVSRKELSGMLKSFTL